MEYVIVTVEWLISHGYFPSKESRKSKDGTKVVLGYGTVAPLLAVGETIKSYYRDELEFIEILNSEEWSWEAATLEEEFVDTNFNMAANILNAYKHMSATIDSYEFSDSQKVALKEFYPNVENYISKPIEEGTLVVSSNHLWRATTTIDSFTGEEFTEENFDMLPEDTKEETPVETPKETEK